MVHALKRRRIRADMTIADFHLISPPMRSHFAQCFRCRLPFDLGSAEMCGCIARERTFVCPRCGSCACRASSRQRNEFWVTAPPALWDRRRLEQVESFSRLQSLDPDTLPRPFALIVDDDPLVLTVAEHALREMGFTSLTNSNAEEAYAIANSLVPDLVLTDALMPRLDGRELCLRLKNNPRTGETRVIVMSAIYRGSVYRNEAFKTFHVDEYLEKPIKPGVLREAVARLMPDLARAHPHSKDVRMAS